MFHPRNTFRFVCASAIVLTSLPSLAAVRDLFVSSDFTHSVKRYDGDTGAYLGDFVTAGSGGLTRPQGIAFGPDGNLYVSSGSSGFVHKYDGQTGASMGTFTSGYTFGFGADMEFRNGRLYVSDFKNGGGVYAFDATTGVFIEKFTKGKDIVADGMVWGTDGNFYVSDWGTNTIQRYDSSGNYIDTFASGGGLSGPLDLRQGDDGHFYVNSFMNGRVKQYHGTTGAYLGDFITGLGSTQGQLIDPNGDLLVGSYNGNRIDKYNATTGAFIGTFTQGGGLNGPNNFVYSPVPEPATLAFGLPALLLLRRRRRSESQY